jgi:hypothetical protein
MSAPVVEAVRLFGDGNRAVAKLTVDDFHFGSIFVVDCKTAPRVSWPQTQKGFPIVECRDPAKKREIEELILTKVRSLL